MPTYHYQSHIQQQNAGPAFTEENTSSGHYWLAVVSGQKKEVLLNRLSQLLGNANAPTLAQFEQTLEQFYDWFREAYQQAKGIECPLADEQIVEGVGIVWLNPQGQATIYSQRNFGLCRLCQDKVESFGKGYQQRQLQAGDLLIADPSQADIALTVVNAYRQGSYSWEAITIATYNFPVAIVQAQVSKVEPLVKPSNSAANPDEESDRSTSPVGRAMVFVTLIVGLLAVGYFYLMPRFAPDYPAEMATDASQQFQPVDSMAIDNTVATETVVKPVADEVLPEKNPDSTTTTPVSSETGLNKQETNVPAPVQPNVKPSEKEHDPADEYLRAARLAAAKAEEARKAGDTLLAAVQYNLAIASFNRFEALRPAERGVIAKQLARCKSGLAMLKESPTF